MDTDFGALSRSTDRQISHQTFPSVCIRVYPWLNSDSQAPTPLKPPSGLLAYRQMRRPTRQAPENLTVILAFDGHAADAFLIERPVRKPARIGHHNDTPFARFGDGEQTTGLIARAFLRLLIQIIHHERAWFRRMRQIEQQQVAGVIRPAQSAD